MFFFLVSVEGDDLLELFDWLSKVWYHLNEIVEDFCDSDATLGIYSWLCKNFFLCKSAYFVSMCGGNLRFESFVPNKFPKDISFSRSLVVLLVSNGL